MVTDMETEKIKNFGSLLKKRRTELGYLQKDIATAAGTAVSTVNNWEKGVNLPLCDKFSILCDFLKVPYEYFLGESDTKIPEFFSDDEKNALSMYRSMSEKDKDFIKMVMNHELQKKEL